MAEPAALATEGVAPRPGMHRHEPERITLDAGHREPRAGDDILELSPSRPPPPDRPEPQIDARRAVAPPHVFVRLIRRGIAVLIERREPHLDPRRRPIAPDSLFAHAILSQMPRRRRWALGAFIVVSLLLHAALIASIHFSLFGGGTDDTIPVQLVLEQPQDKAAQPPPPPPPPPKQQQQQQEQKQPEKQKPPPRGRLASDELGDPDATGDKPTATHAPAAGQAEPKPGEAPPPPSETAANQKQDEPVRPKPPEDQQRSDAPKEQNQAPQQLAAAGAVAPPPVPNAPDSEIAIRPERKPSPVQLMPVPPGGARRPTERPNEPSHGEGHKAKYPGPDATQDEYLAYIRDLTNIQLSALPPGPFEGRKGSATFNVRIRPNGSIVWFALVSSSGDDRADRLLSGALNEIDKFPPLPQELLDPKGEPVPLTLTLPLAIIPKLARSR